MIPSVDAKGRPLNDPNFKPIESHYLSFPLVEKDFLNWEAKHSAIILRDKVIVSPEV
jgi:hypothetical protein